MIRTKRVYETAAGTDGRRVLVDRLWPRGVSKDRAGIDDWPKEVAPSSELRQWFGHDPAKWLEFKARHLDELSRNAAAKKLKDEAKSGTMTLLYAARDSSNNHALVLKEFLED